MAGWEIRPLYEVCDVEKRKHSNGPATYVGLEDISSDTGEFVGRRDGQSVKSATFAFTDKHLLYGRLRPYLNKVLTPDFAGHCSTEIFPLRPHEKLDRRFLFHWITSEITNRRIDATCTGARMPRANMNEVMGFEIPIPPLEEQRRIAAVLDDGFDGLALARAHIEANLRDAQELFASFLGGFFDSVDDGWTAVSIGSLVEEGILAKPQDGNHGEIHPKKADFVSSGIPFVMASDLVDGTVDQTNCYFISREQADSLRKGFAVDGDILLSHKGTIGRTAMLKTSYDYVMLTPQVTYYRVKDTDRLLPEFLFFAFQSASFQHQIATAAEDGATRAYIGITRQLELVISVPDIFTQGRLVEQFQEARSYTPELILAYKTKLQDVDNLRQSLLREAFSGELT
ncbi:restriction endonuclease subunit S [Mesorhizobium caraganae]|uniref:restriction endonuclease subunit S n=1 Tax=Mesorhizobium caraganae TaxID=483206 RepID=UPI00193A6896|nr:restriction endonuclease subunit S [Mesorhizobium caraganae]MBM2715843.1 restriction endonuclease subunit S [Mesorhizobium caraganae]